MGRIAELRTRVRGIDCGTVWLCDCCTLAAHGYDCCQLDGHDGPLPLSDVDARYRLTPGMAYAEHDDGCEVKASGEWPDDYECECERETFSGRRCAGCGTYLAGSREAFTLWREPQRFISRYGLTLGPIRVTS